MLRCQEDAFLEPLGMLAHNGSVAKTEFIADPWHNAMIHRQVVMTIK